MSVAFTPYKASTMLLPVLIGICGFLIIAGPQFLNPVNVAWFAGGDSLQHYLGWAFYRNSSWTWPVGLNPSYGMEFSNSIVFTDSIPLLAIPFKFLSQLLPSPFQYFGIWVLLCFVAQAYFAFRIIQLLTKSVAIQCIACILFIFSPPMIFRMALHESLMGHFIILAALYLNLKPGDENQKGKKRHYSFFPWAILLSIAVLTHFYLAVMILVLWLADLSTRVFVSKKTSFKQVAIEIIVVFVVIGCIAWQAGYFAIESASGATRGFGDFRTNLLALFNSRGWSYLLRPIPLKDAVEAATGEGFQYLGAGSLFLLLCAIYAVIRRKINVISIAVGAWREYRFLIIALLLLALISFSNHIGFGPWNVTVPLPEMVMNLLSLVRASSRLFWPLYYALLILISYTVIRAFSPKWCLLLFIVAAILQVIDTSAGWLPIREKVSMPASAQFKSSLQNPFWREAGSYYHNLVTNNGNDNWGDFGIFASANQMATNITYMARVDAKKIAQSYSQVNQQLHQGPLHEKTLYVFQEWKSAPDQIRYDSQKDLLAKIDGVSFLAPGWKACKSCAQVPQEFVLTQLAPNLKIGQVVDFTKSGNGRANFMLGGWGFTEDWGTWATDGVAKVILPMPEGEPSKLIVKANAFLSQNHPEQVVDIAINGVRVADHMVLKNAKDNLIEVKLAKGLKTPGEPVMIEFRSLDAISPQTAGLGPDERKLGIGLVSIQFAR